MVDFVVELFNSVDVCSTWLTLILTYHFTVEILETLDTIFVIETGVVEETFKIEVFEFFVTMMLFFNHKKFFITEVVHLTKFTLNDFF